MPLLATLRHPIRAVRAALTDWLGTPIRLTDGDFWAQLFANGSFTGRPVTVDSTLKLSTAWACVRLISETIATLPLGLYLRKLDGSRESATTHPLYELLHNQPNADMTAVMFWEVVLSSMLLWGNSYTEIVRNRTTIVALNFLNPRAVTWRRLSNGSREYQYVEPGRSTVRKIAEADMMHIPAFSVDGVNGLSPISYGANVFGTATETDRASAETFKSAMRAPGIITMNQVMNNEQRETLRAHIKKVSDEGGVMVVETGQEFKPLTFNPHDAELLQSREWNAAEICRFFGVDPAIVGHGGKDSNWGTGLEQKMLWLVMLTLRKWCVRIEQAIRKNLLTPAERTKYFAEFAMEGLLRGDSAARVAFYSTMTQNGIMTRDECRKLENLSPMGGKAGVLTVQSAMVAIDDMNAGGNADSQTARDALMAWLGIEPVAGAPAKE